ncbi:hypothetical protein BV22DRAFT_982311, partial [Leucogyrophana mollusca]
AATATTKFQFSLPFALLPVSPALSALHASRVHRLHPTEAIHLNSSHCSKCGRYLLDGDGTVTLKRTLKRKRKAGGVTESQRVYRKTCRACGTSVDVPFISTGSKQFPRVKSPGVTTTPVIGKPTMVQSQITSRDIPTSPFPGTPRHSSTPPVAQVPPKLTAGPPSVSSKGRPKKKAGLQEMLERNRQMEKQSEKKKRDGQSSLAAFLTGL